MWQGYGQVQFNDKNCRAHRVFYENLVGPVPPGKEIDHLCRVRCCVNPKHMEAVSRRVNVRRSSVAKLTPEQIRDIKCVPTAAEGGLGNLALGKLYGVSNCTVSNIRTGIRWADVT